MGCSWLLPSPPSKRIDVPGIDVTLGPGALDGGLVGALVEGASAVSIGALVAVCGVGTTTSDADGDGAPPQAMRELERNANPQTMSSDRMANEPIAEESRPSRSRRRARCRVQSLGFGLDPLERLDHRRVFRQRAQRLSKEGYPGLHAVPRGRAAWVRERDHVDIGAMVFRLANPADDFDERAGVSEHFGDREGPNRNDERRTKDRDLFFEEWTTAFDLDGGGSPITAALCFAWKTAGDSGDVDPRANVVFRGSGRFFEPTEECFAGGPREGSTEASLAWSRRLTH
jgi:hypothetical protein